MSAVSSSFEEHCAVHSGKSAISLSLRFANPTQRLARNRFGQELSPTQFLSRAVDYLGEAVGYQDQDVTGIALGYGRREFCESPDRYASLWLTPMLLMPARRAPWTPATESSMTMHLSGDAPDAGRGSQKDLRIRLSPAHIFSGDDALKDMGSSQSLKHCIDIGTRCRPGNDLKPSLFVKLAQPMCNSRERRDAVPSNPATV